MKTFLIILLILSLPFLLKKILFGYVQWQANSLTKTLSKKNPENAKSIQKMHDLSKSINQKIKSKEFVEEMKELEKTDPEEAKKIRDLLDL